MKTLDPKIKEVIDSVHYRPAVSIILPFETKINMKSELKQALKIVSDKVELTIQKSYTEETCSIIMKKLRNIIENVNYETDKKGIAIFVSIIFEKVFYLDFEVQEKIVVDNTFEIRDLVYCSKPTDKYLILVLSANESKMYLSDSDQSVTVIPKTRLKSASFLSDKAKNEHVSLHPDLSKHKEVELNKFLLYVDNELDGVIKRMDLPLFILGSIKTTAHFKKLSKHLESVAGTIDGNYVEATTAELKDLLEPHIAGAKKAYEKELLAKIEEADSQKKLAVGIQNVWREAVSRKGNLLIVEKNYIYAAEHGGAAEVIYPVGDPLNKYALIKDAVDEVIEKVIEYGGDIEFVDDGVLDNFEHIALILYF